MSRQLEITFLHHSGFAIRTGDTLLVFDDARGPAQPGEETAGRITPQMIAGCGRTLFFATHAHGDHFNPSIYQFADAGMVHYVLGFDIPQVYSGYHLAVGDHLSLGGAEITAYGSTDEGVSFLVEIDGWRLFHAGDLNLWHWREVSTRQEIEDAERAYETAVAPLLDANMDIAMFPLDARLGEQYDAGALHFLMNARPRIMIPMHWWDRPDVALDFARKNRTPHTEIIALTRDGETIRVEKAEDGAVERVIEG